MINLRWQHIAILLLTSGLVACTTAGHFPGPSQGPETVAYSDAGRMAAGIGGECNASQDSSRGQYIVDYVSLIQDESRNRTSPQADPAYPVGAQPKARQIDDLLYEKLRQYVSRIKTESGG